MRRWYVVDCLEVELTTANGQPALGYYGARAPATASTTDADDAGESGPSFRLLPSL